jgi:hypothetical protein
MGDKKTLAEILYPLPTPELRTELEEFRIEWERLSKKKVDLTRYYVSMWPDEKREWLFVNDTQRYFDSLPEFVKDWMFLKMEAGAAAGTLDNAGDRFLKLYMSGGMTRRHLGRG